MAKRVHRYLVRVLVTSGLLMSMTGCNFVTNSALLGDLPSSPSEVAMFIQQFAQEALAAFLF